MQEDILDHDNTPALRSSIFRYSIVEITIALSNLIILLYTLLDQNYDVLPILAFKALILFMTMSTGYLIYRWSYFVTQKSIEKRTLALAKISNNTVGLGLAAGLFWGLIGLFSIMSIVVVRTWEINQIIIPVSLFSLGIIQSIYASLARSKYKHFTKE
jgi:hypothetical protein